MSKKAIGRQKQLKARALLKQSKLVLQMAVLESEPAAKSVALQKAKDLAQTAETFSNEAAASVR